MRILLISQYFWPEEFRINAICEELKKLGHHVEVLTGIPNYPQGTYYEGYSLSSRREEEYKGIKITRVPLVSRGNSKLRLIINYLSFAFFGSLNKYLKEFKDFDISLVYEVSPITQAYPAIRLKKKYKIPICMYVCDLWPESLQFAGNINNRLILKVVRNMVSNIYNQCDGLLFSSKGFAKNIQEYRYPTDKMMYFPNWAEESYKIMDKEEGEKTARIESNDKFVVMYAGNIGEAQGFDTILEAAAHFIDNKDIIFVILGDGRRFEKVQRLAKERALTNTNFLGKKHYTQMSAYFSQASVLLATLKDHPIARLTLPGRVVSFMACGKPIISNIQGETAEIIKEANAGICCNADDGYDLAKAIQSAYIMPKEQLRKLGMNGYEYASKYFSKERLITGVSSFLEMLKERQ